MVTAGVYLVARSAPLYTLVPAAQTTVALVGAVTALFAATIAVGQYDIKKVLAYSTICQLGFMVAAVGMGAFVAGMFHLVTHAFFKALLFLSAGSVILGMERGHHHLAHHDEHRAHRMRKSTALGMAKCFDPERHAQHGRAAQADAGHLLGLPDRRAGAGRHLPLRRFLVQGRDPGGCLHRSSRSVYWLLTIAAFLTAFYMGRQIWMVFFGEPRHAAAEHAEESPGSSPSR